MNICDNIVNIENNQVKCGSTVWKTEGSFYAMRTTFANSTGDKVYCMSCQQESKSLVADRFGWEWYFMGISDTLIKG